MWKYLNAGVNEIIGNLDVSQVFSNDNASSNTQFSQITQNLQIGYYAIKVVQKNENTNLAATHYKIALYCGSIEPNSTIISKEIDLERHKSKKINLQNLPNDIYFLHLIERSGARVQRQVILQK